MQARNKNSLLRRVTVCIAMLAIGAALSPKAMAQPEPCVYNNKDILSTWRSLNLDRNMVIVIAHRGWWGLHNGPTNSCGARLSNASYQPENSFSSVIDAFHSGFEAVEVDIKMTKDGIPILMHDFTLGRNTNINQLEHQPAFNPYTGEGFNPYVNQVNWSGTIDHAHLLNFNRMGVSAQPVPAFAQLLDQYKQFQTAGIIVLDVKDRNAMKAVWKLMNNHANDTGDLARNWVAVKFNVTTYPDPQLLEEDLFAEANPHGGSINGRWNEPFLGIPVITNNMLDKLPNLAAIEEEYFRHDYTLGMEVNINTKNGRLQSIYNAVGAALMPVGIFNPMPDYGAYTGSGENEAFYMNTGKCCYRLSTVAYGDPSVDRWNWSFLYGNGWKAFDFITTDEAGKMMDDLAAKGLRGGNSGMIH